MRVPNALSSRAAARAAPDGVGVRASIIHASIVHAVDGVRFVALGCTRSSVVARLGAYVACCAGERLWPGDARQVRRLLRAGEVHGAVAAYFATVGTRWDEEWLTHCRVVVPARRRARRHRPGAHAAAVSSRRERA